MLDPTYTMFIIYPHKLFTKKNTRVLKKKKIDWFYTAHEGLMKVIILRKGVTISGSVS